MPFLLPALLLSDDGRDFSRCGWIHREVFTAALLVIHGRALASLYQYATH